MNKRTIFGILGAFLVGCVVGSFWGEFKYGYSYQLIDEKAANFLQGKVILKHSFEGPGHFRLMDTARNEIVFDNGLGLSLTLYKSQEGFQDGIGAVSDIKVKDHDVEWDDGIYRYRLNMQPAGKEKAGEKK